MIVKTDGSSAALVESLQCECDAMSGTLQSQDWAAAGAWWRSEAGECGTLPSAGLSSLLPGYTALGPGCVKPYSDKKQYISLEDDSYF